MNTVVLNVGLNVSESNNDGRAMVLDRMAVQEAVIYRLTGVQALATEALSSTEPTAVIRLKTDLDARQVEGIVNYLAARFKQDAIAYTFNGVGYMVGPNAAKWGAFNPNYFIFLDELGRLLRPMSAEAAEDPDAEVERMEHALNMPSHGDLLAALDSIITTAEELGVDMEAIDDARRLVGR